MVGKNVIVAGAGKSGVAATGLLLRNGASVTLFDSNTELDKEKILGDFEYISNCLYKELRNQYFTIEDFAKIIREKYGIAKARIIANSLFELVDPDGRCVKHRNDNSTGKTYYTISNGNFKEFMRKPIIKSNIIPW